MPEPFDPKPYLERERIENRWQAIEWRLATLEKHNCHPIDLALLIQKEIAKILREAANHADDDL